MINIQQSQQMSKLHILVLAFLLAITYSQCPTGCNSCVTPTNCTTCSARYFMVNNTFCAPCPAGCSACVQTMDIRPNCTACDAPAQLDLTNQCFICDPNCLTCAATPTNCTSCRDGRELSGYGECVAPVGCNITNCAECANDTTGNQICSRCIQGYFPFMQSCIPCTFSCDACDFIFPMAWNQASIFLDQIIRPAYNISTPTVAPGTLPIFFNNLDFSTMDEQTKNGWLKTFLILVVANSTIENNFDGFIRSIPTHIEFFIANRNKTWAELERLIVQRFNNFTAKNFTVEEFNRRIQLAATKFSNCATCAAGFVLNNTVCDRCPAGCTQCASGTCTQCRNGTFLAGGGICTPCTAPCLTCTASATNCTSCVSPASLSANSCVVCQDPCATCSPSNQSSCITCKKPFSLVADNGLCFRCDQDLCDVCQSTNTSICLNCRQGATLINGICQQCPANCSSCYIGLTFSACFLCKTGYWLNMTDANSTVCLPCSPGCLACDQRVCQECQPGTFLNLTDGVCLQCKRGCTACTSLEVCTSYENGVVIIDDQVITCRPGCKVCDSPQNCIQCEPRFFLSAGYCHHCQPGCEACTSQVSCTKCVDNMIVSGGNCTACQGNCRTCSSSNVTECLTCKRGFTLVATQCVNQCQKGCLECDAANSTICTICSPGHSLRADAKCVKCLGSCSGSCDPRNISICLNCVDGFELKNNQCVRCPLGCATCLVGECSTCVPGFSLSQGANSSFICVEDCLAPCSNCSDGVCLGCQYGFTFNSGRCDPDLSCNPSCDFCPIGTQKVANGTCVLCPENCASCGSGVCFGCLPGYYLNTTTCSACASMCKSCYNYDTCDQCADGFVKQILSMTSNIADAVFSDNCTACSSNCKTCIVQPDRCTSCPDGSRLKGSRCSGMFTVQYEYEINIPYETFLTNSESENFLQTISNMTGIDSADNFISYVREGSTIFGGSMSTSSSSQATSVRNTLGSSSPGSYSILSSSASVYYGDSAYTEPVEQEKSTIQSANIGLIVGVAVGGVVALTVISFLIYKYKCKKPQIQVKQDSSTIEFNQKY